MEPRRSYPGDGEQRWYDGEDWERGRHGAPASPGGAGAAYNGEAAAYGADSYGDDGYERRFNTAARFGDPLTDSSSGSIPAVQADVAGPVGSVGSVGSPGSHGTAGSLGSVGGSAGSAEAGRRPVEAIDVAALRRPPVSSPPDAHSPAYPSGPPPEFPPANYAPAATAYSGPAGDSPAYSAGDQPAYSAGDSPAYSAGDQPVYPAGSTYGAGSNNPLSAPTAAVNTIQPGTPSVYHSRKPAIAIVLAVLTVLFEIPALRLLVSATIEDVVSVSGVVSGTFLVLGLPLFGYGIYGLLNGAPPSSLTAWLRQPLVYLPLGLLLFVLAALAAA